jgi:hypothetical protein
VRHVRACLLVAVAFVAGRAPAVEVAFNSLSDLTLFNRQQAAQYTLIGWNSNVGVGGGGGLGVSAQHNSTYSAQSFDVSAVGSTLDLATFFRAKDPGIINPGNGYRYANVYATSDATKYSGGEKAFQSTVTEYSSRLEIGGIMWNGFNSGSGFSYELPKGTVQPGRWYQFRTRYENVGVRRFNWELQLNDYGISGTEFVNTVATFRRQELDLDSVLNDTTLYGGFGAIFDTASAIDNFSANAGTLNLPVQQATILPTFDVELQVAGSTKTIIEGGTGIRLGRSTQTAPPSEAIIEFPLSGIPEGARIVSATLQLSPNVTLGTPRLKVTGYEGDGLASISDAETFATLHSGYNFDASGGTLAIPLDAANVSMLLGGTHLGFRVTNLLPENSMFINAIENTFFDKHKLVLNYFTPAGPADFDTDGDVDASDLQMWKNALARDYLGDADGDFITTGNDFLSWQRGLGGTASVGSAATAEARPVPEPQAALLVAVSALVCACGRCKRSPRL